MESLLVVGGLAVGILALTLLAKLLKNRAFRASLAEGERNIERLARAAASYEEQLQRAVRFADPISGRSVTERALGALKWVRPEGTAGWSIGNDPTHTHATADWRIVDGAGVLAAARGVGLSDTMTGGRMWADALAKVVELAAREGIAHEIITSPLAATGERVKQNVVWERV